MDLISLAKEIPLFYIITMVFYGIIFSLQQIDKRFRPNQRFQAVVVLLLLNLVLSNVIFLLIGTYGAAFTMTKLQMEKKK